MCIYGSVVCKERLLMSFGLMLRKVKEVSVTSGVEVYTIILMAEGVRKQQGKEHGKQCRAKYTLLFPSTPNWEWSLVYCHE